MKPHRGMRPYDIAILLAIAIQESGAWRMRGLSRELGISASEVSESIHRSKHAGLIKEDKRRLAKLEMLEFLEHGLRYVYPPIPGPIVMGLPTAHSHFNQFSFIRDQRAFVWQHPQGTTQGLAIDPLHPRLPDACLRNPVLYDLLALCDSLRVGEDSERQQAINELRYRL